MNQEIEQVSRSTRHLAFKQLFASLSLHVKKYQSKLFEARFLDLEVRARAHEYALNVHHIEC